MRRLLNRAEAPPVDGEDRPFRYTFPETGFIAYASDYNSWELKIKEHAIANSIPIPGMDVCEDQLCGTLPPDRCKYDVGDKGPVNINFSLGDVADWVKAVTTKFVTGAKFVSQAEADRRAQICVRCPLNTQIQGGCGGGCGRLAEMLTPGMQSRSTRWDDKLKSCAVCKCFVKIMVHFPMSALEASDSPHHQNDYPVEYCWKSRKSPNYRNA